MTDSYVPDDPMPHLVRGRPDLFALPATILFQKANDAGEWPLKWKVEKITVIPKTKKTSFLSENRDISCTALLPKILVDALPEQLRAELHPDPNQYGGAKACGAEHLLNAAFGAQGSPTGCGFPE